MAHALDDGVHCLMVQWRFIFSDASGQRPALFACSHVSLCMSCAYGPRTRCSVSNWLLFTVQTF